MDMTAQKALLAALQFGYLALRLAAARRVEREGGDMFVVLRSVGVSVSRFVKALPGAKSYRVRDRAMRRLKAVGNPSPREA